MSIAVSAIVQPSRILFALTAAIAVMSVCTGIAIGFGVVGVDLPAYARLPLAATVIFLSFFGFYHGICKRKPIHIDISGTGQIRITKLTSNSPCMDANRPHVRQMGELVSLVDDSTIWPSMLLLRLRAASGGVTNTLVLPDSVSKAEFRALSVACRWAAERKDECEREFL